MAHVEIANNAYPFPMPVVVVGAMVEGRPNLMAVAWVSRVEPRPPMIAVAMGKRHYTNVGIHETKAFSVNIPGVDLLEKVDYCGLVSGRTVDKSEVFTIETGAATGAPLIAECPVVMECRLERVVDLPNEELFIGEIVSVRADEGCLTDGTPDIEKVRPFTLTMPDNRYWSLGAETGKAWEAGKRLTT